MGNLKPPFSTLPMSSPALFGPTKMSSKHPNTSIPDVTASKAAPSSLPKLLRVTQGCLVLVTCHHGCIRSPS
eukprot:9730163-Karenia_brevis.AAC.1